MKPADLFPEWYDEWLFKSLKLKNGDETSPRISQALNCLNDSWLVENYQQSDYDWEAEATQQAYALFYMTVNIPKLWLLLENSTSNSGGSRSIADFGCGPGTFTWALLFYLYKKEPRQLSALRTVEFIDSSEACLNTARLLWDGLIKHPEFNHIKASFHCSQSAELIDRSEADTALFGNTLVEDRDSLEKISLTNASRLIIIEPGTSKHFKRLRQLRLKLIELQWNIHFPCPGHDKCPMSDDNWCHFHINRNVRPFVQRLCSSSGRQNHRHHFCGFDFSREPASQGPNWRLLSGPRKKSGSVIRFVCNGSRLRELVVNRKSKSDNNRFFTKGETAAIGHFTTLSDEKKALRHKRIDADSKFLAGIFGCKVEKNDCF